MSFFIYILLFCRGRIAYFIPSVGDALILFLFFFIYTIIHIHLYAYLLVLPVCLFICTGGMCRTFYSRGCHGGCVGIRCLGIDAGWVWQSHSWVSCRVFWGLPTHLPTFCPHRHRHRRPLLRVGIWGLLPWVHLVVPLPVPHTFARHRLASERVPPDHYPVPSFHRRGRTYTRCSMVHGRPLAVWSTRRMSWQVCGLPLRVGVGGWRWRCLWRWRCPAIALPLRRLPV